MLQLHVFEMLYPQKKVGFCERKIEIMMALKESLLIEKNPIAYDLFLETLFINRATEKEVVLQDRYSMITVLKYEFEECLKIIKKDCQYKNLKAHYSDFRSMLLSYKNSIIKHIYHNYQKNHTNRYKISILEQNIIQLLKNPLAEFNKIEVEVKDIFKHPKIIKQISNGDLKNQLELFIDTSMSQLRTQVESNIKEGIYSFYTTNLSTLIKNINKPGFKNYINEFLKPYMRLYSLSMDIYLIARMLRKNGSKNNIVYVGDNHANLYVQFLNSIGAIHTLTIKADTSSAIKFDSHNKDKSFLFN